MYNWLSLYVVAYKNLKNNPSGNSSTQVKQCSSSVEYKLVVVNSDPINDILAKTNMECTVLLAGVRFSLCGVLCYFHIWIRIRRICVKSNTSCTKVNIFMPPLSLLAAAFILDIIKCKSSQPFFLPLSSMLCFGLFDDVCSMFTMRTMGPMNLKSRIFIFCATKRQLSKQNTTLKSQLFKTSN